jgi:hypothetical protein
MRILVGSFLVGIGITVQVPDEDHANVFLLHLTSPQLILSIFRFTNIKAARVITSTFKSSIEISLFQWSQISRHPDWKPYIDAWFRRFEVSVNLKF